jgi:transcriptional regulator of acetoin/glycerol metabolism
LGKEGSNPSLPAYFQGGNVAKRGPKNIYSRDDMFLLYDKLNGNYSQIAKQLGCSRELVRQVLSSLGLKATKAKHPDVVKKQQEIAKSIENLSFKEAKELTNLTDRKLRTVLKHTNTKLTKHSNTKYTNEQIVAAYNKHNGHYSKMAEDLGMFHSCLCRLMKNRGLSKQYPAKGRSCKNV